MRKSSFVLPVAALALVAATALPASAEPVPRVDVKYAPAEIARPGEFLVELDDDAPADDVLSRARIKHTMSRWSDALNGFAARLSPRQLERLRSDSRVSQIVQNVAVRGASSAPVEASAVQADPGWALDRIDQAALPLDGTFTANSTGAGVNVYVIDNGIDTGHTDFGGRASTVYDPIGGATDNDCLTHGTGVAGVLGGARYGVAKEANLLSVRFANCDDIMTLDNFIGAVNWVKGNHQKPAVANISSNFTDFWTWYFGSGIIRNAVNALADAGVFVAASAGNDNVDACTQPPADALGAFTVGATDSTDTRAFFSNWGTCVEIYAPGSNVDMPKAGGGYRTWSGTSFAAPYVAGVAALYKATYGDAPSTTIGTWLTDNATPGVVNGNSTPGPTPNLLLNTGGL